jgi:hypothetical protein
MELPYERYKYHVCWICQSRLIELAKADFQFRLREQVVAITATPEVPEEKIDPKRGYKAQNTQQVLKDAE